MNSPQNRLIACFLSALVLLSACGSGAGTTDTATEQADATTATVASLPEQTESIDSSSSDADDTDPSVDTSQSGDDDPSTEDLSPEEAQLKFEQCLEDAGIENPFGGAEGESITGGDASQQGESFALEIDEGDFEAFDRCNEILSDAFGEFTPSPEQEALFKDAELEFNQCMTDKGFDISGDSQGFELSGDISIDDLEIAADECDAAFDSLNSQLEAESEDS